MGKKFKTFKDFEEAEIKCEVDLFTDKERQLLIDALIFTGCADIVSHFGKKRCEKMIDLAVKIGVDPSKKISLFKGGRYENPELAKKVEDNFNIKIEK